MASTHATRAAPARPGNGSRHDRLSQAIDRQNSNQLRKAQRIDRDIIVASEANLALVAATRAARTQVITVSPYIRPDGTRHSNAFEARLGGAVLCVSETPLLDAARALLARGIARPDDTIVMRHAASDVDAIRARVGVAADLTISDPRGGRRIALRRWEEFARARPRIARTPSRLPGQPPAGKSHPGASAGHSRPQGGGGVMADAALKVLNAGRDIGDLASLPPRQFLLGTVFCKRNASMMGGPGGIGFASRNTWRSQPAMC